MNEIEKLGEYARSLGCEVRFDEPMSRHTTFRIGGPADVFLVVNDAPSLGKICRWASETGVRLFLLGNGSNLLVSDAGIRGGGRRARRRFQRDFPLRRNFHPVRRRRFPCFAVQLLQRSSL